MKVWLVINAVDEPYFGGTSAILEKWVYKDIESADKKHGQFTVWVEASNLNPSMGICIDFPITPKKYENWYKENGEWANEVVKYIYVWGKEGILTLDQMFPRGSKK